MPDNIKLHILYGYLRGVMSNAKYCATLDIPHTKKIMNALESATTIEEYWEMIKDE